jgi:hypothetical protein
MAEATIRAADDGSISGYRGTGLRLSAGRGEERT